MTAKNFVIIKSKFSDSPINWRILPVVKTTEKSVYIPGYGKPDRIDMDRVVAFAATTDRCDEIVTKARAVEMAHQPALNEAMMAAKAADDEARMMREAAIQEARRVYDIATRETKAAQREAAKVQADAIAALVASETGASE